MNMVGAEKIVESLQAQGKAIGLTIQHLAWEVMADACNDMIKYSPPRTEAGGGWGEQRKIGENAIASDLGALFKPDDERTNEVMVIHNRYNGRYYYRPIDRKVADWVSEIPPSRIAQGDLSRIHHAYRKKNGRVQNRPPIHLAPAAAIDNYLKTVQDDVGKLKSGWLTAADYFCGKVGKKKSAPSWVTRHAEPSRYEDNMGIDGDGMLRADNLAPTAGAVRRDAILFVMRKRQRDIDKWLPKRAEKIAERIAAASADAGAVPA